MLKCMNKALGVKFKNECETLNHDEILHILNFCARDPHDLWPLRLRIVEFASMFNIHTHVHAIFVATELVYLLHPTFNKVTKKKTFGRFGIWPTSIKAWPNNCGFSK